MVAVSEQVGAAVTVAAGQRYVVIDNALSPDAFAAWTAEERSAKMRPAFSSIDPVFDGISFYADTSTAPEKMAEGHVEEVRAAIRGGLDVLRIAAADPEHARFYRYGRGSGLDWHDDGKSRVAAFILYLSAEWRATWGGELELFDCSVDDVPCVEFNVAKDLMNAPTVATSIAPRPNRLVVMAGGTFHRVRKVEPSAGDNLRRSISGFLLGAAEEDA